MAAARKRWAQAHEAERLSQLIYDVESATGRYMTVCLAAAVAMPAARAQWEADAAAAEEMKNVMVARCKVLLHLCCGE